jgi:hypothetical protein
MNTFHIYIVGGFFNIAISLFALPLVGVVNIHLYNSPNYLDKGNVI